MRLRRIISEPEFEGGIYYRKEKYSHDPELREAYECGKKDAMREMRDGYHERRGNVTHYGAGGGILYREEPEWDDDDVEYRRYRRNHMGRFIP